MTDIEIEKIHAEITKLNAETAKIQQGMKYYPFLIIASPFLLAILGQILKGM